MTESTRQERANGRRYMWQVGGAATIYLLLVVLPPFFVEQGTPLGVVLALLPILPAVWMFVAVLQFMRNLDEYQRPRLMRALAASFGVAMLTALVLGMVENAIGGLRGAVWFVFIAGMMTWMIAAAILQARDAR